MNKRLGICFLLVVLLVLGCIKFDVPICGYCESPIRYYMTEEKFASTRYENDAALVDGVRYHPWCIKTMELDKAHAACKAAAP